MSSTTRRTMLWLLAAGAITVAARPAHALPPGAPAPTDPAFPKFALNYVDDLHRGESSQGVLEMKVKTRHFSRAMALESWSLGKDYSLIRILQPKKERGSATLKARDDLFTYLNKTGRTIKITGAMMGGAWMGSHFTNDDLVKGTRLADDYTARLTGRGTVDGTPLYTFTLIPDPDAPVVWGKIVITVRQDDLQPVEQQFFDEDGTKLRVLEFSDYRSAGGRLMPMKMVMRPLDKPGEFTQILWKRVDFGVNLDAGFFTLQKLKSL